MNAYLVYKKRVFPITNELVKLGRDLENTLVFSNKSISRFHAEIMIESGGYLIKDLNSTSGTYINGKPVQGTAPLQTKDEISLAGTDMIFYTGEDKLDIETKMRTGALKRINPNTDRL